ncbi:MAG: hypothetical protein EBV03_12445, partial [Proteobacteria bacterium]|nr:hypothetical protein [Pseudomonadota bacterium]
SAAEPKDRKELLQAMLRQLEAMTGRAWEAAMPDEAGRLVKTDVMYTNCESKDLHFRTCEDIAAPAAARAAIYNYLGTATVRGYLASVNKPSPVAFPASLVRRAHLKPGQEGVLSQAFGAVSEPGKNGGNPPEGVGRA